MRSLALQNPDLLAWVCFLVLILPLALSQPVRAGEPEVEAVDSAYGIFVDALAAQDAEATFEGLEGLVAIEAETVPGSACNLYAAITLFWAWNALGADLFASPILIDFTDRAFAELETARYDCLVSL